jgi:hypothetical protein
VDEIGPDCPERTRHLHGTEGVRLAADGKSGDLDSVRLKTAEGGVEGRRRGALRSIDEADEVDAPSAGRESRQQLEQVIFGSGDRLRFCEMRNYGHSGDSALDREWLLNAVT